MVKLKRKFSIFVNNIENNTAEYSKRAEKRLENMKTHAHMLGKDSSWFNDPKYGEEYRNILKELKNKP